MDAEELDELWRRACRADAVLSRLGEPEPAPQLVAAVAARVLGIGPSVPDAALKGIATGFASASWMTVPEAVYGQLSTLVTEAANGPGASLNEALRVLAILGDASASLLLDVWRSQAEQDQLTSLGNRRRLESTTAILVSASRRFQYASIDVDGLKAINDGPGGHEAGDTLLRAIGYRLSTGLSAIGATAQRHGGDEFSVLLPDPARDFDLDQHLEELCAALPEGQSFSHGTASWPDDDRDVNTVFKRADQVMYERKRAKKEAAIAAMENPGA